MKKRLSLLMLCAALLIAVLGGCSSDSPSGGNTQTPDPAQTETPGQGTGDDAEWATANVGIHNNAPGASLFATALKMGYFDEEHITPNYTIVTGGAAEMAAMRTENPTLDIGFIGAGVAWNAMDASGVPISFVFMDDISNNEQLLVNESVGLTPDSSWEEIYNALKGQTVFVDTSTTPGGWMKEFVTRVNLYGGPGDTEVPDEQKLWIDTEDSSFLEGYTNPNPTGDEAYRVFFYSMSNDTIPAAFQSGDAQICCCYSPSTTTIRNAGGIKVATAETHMPDYTYINTWVANDNWLKENPDVAQRFMNALIKAMDYRSSHEEEAADMAEEVTEAAKDSFYCEDYIVYSAQELSDYLEGFEDGTGYAYELMELLYNDKLGNVESGNPKTLFESCNFTFMKTALENYLGQ